MTEISIEKDNENVKYLIGRLQKEVASTNGYIGVEYDNLVADKECPTRTEALFHQIMTEINVLEGNPGEYVKASEYDEDMPFKTNHNLKQHMIRLGKFVKKYAPKYLPEERAEHFSQEVDEYISI